MKQAVLFDLDGTLWDTSAPVAAVWQAIGREEYDPSFVMTADTMRGLMGKTMDEICLTVLPDSFAGPAREHLVKRWLDEEIPYIDEHPGTPYPHLREVLAELHEQGYFLYVVSNCQKGYIESFLKSLKLEDDFDGHICWGETNLPKRGSIRVLLERENVRKALYVGDTAMDEEEAKAAGLPFVHAAYGFGKAVSPDAVIHSLPELPPIAKKLL